MWIELWLVFLFYLLVHLVLTVNFRSAAAETKNSP